jgi:hypothetical protein
MIDRKHQVCVQKCSEKQTGVDAARENAKRFNETENYRKKVLTKNALRGIIDKTKNW